MGVVRDVTVEQLTQAVGGIDTSGLAKDTTLQATNTALGNINTTLGGITTNDPPTDTTQQSIATALQIIGQNVKPSAVNIPYSNAASGLSANNVQGAIDEVCSDLIQTKTYTASYTVGGNSSISITADDFNATTPNGYTPIGISDFASQNVNVTVRGIYGRATGTSTMMALRNISSTSVTATAYITILYIKTSFL